MYQKEFLYMKATGIVRRIDDLGRVVIPKEIRRTMRIREGDPLHTSLTPYEKFCYAVLQFAERQGLSLRFPWRSADSDRPQHRRKEPTLVQQPIQSSTPHKQTALISENIWRTSSAPEKDGYRWNLNRTTPGECRSFERDDSSGVNSICCDARLFGGYAQTFSSPGFILLFSVCQRFSLFTEFAAYVTGVSLCGGGCRLRSKQIWRHVFEGLRNLIQNRISVAYCSSSCRNKNIFVVNIRCEFITYWTFCSYA